MHKNQYRVLKYLKVASRAINKGFILLKAFILLLTSVRTALHAVSPSIPNLQEQPRALQKLKHNLTQQH